jgi:hypothetical protein
MPLRGSIFGYDVRSDLDLSRLRPQRGERAELRVERAEIPVLDRTGRLLAWSQGPEGGGWHYSLWRAGEQLLASCSATGDFLIDARAGRVVVEPGRIDFEHRLVSSVIPLFAAERGDVVLHASATVADAGAVLFCGPSGRGKSTLAYLLAQAGRPMLAEDGVVVTVEHGTALAWPGPLGARIAGPSGAKATVVPPGGENALAPTPVVAVVALAERGSLPPGPRRLDPADAMPALVASLMHSGLDALGGAFAGAARLAALAPVYRCAMPDDLAGASAAGAALVEQVTGSGAALTPA